MQSSESVATNVPKIIQLWAGNKLKAGSNQREEETMSIYDRHLDLKIVLIQPLPRPYNDPDIALRLLQVDQVQAWRTQTQSKKECFRSVLMRSSWINFSSIRSAV